MTKPASRTPRLLRKVKIDGAWVFQPVAKNGEKYDWDRVLVDGRALASSGIQSPRLRITKTRGSHWY
jgi:hypothetical protein